MMIFYEGLDLNDILEMMDSTEEIFEDPDAEDILNYLEANPDRYDEFMALQRERVKEAFNLAAFSSDFLLNFLEKEEEEEEEEEEKPLSMTAEEIFEYLKQNPEISEEVSKMSKCYILNEQVKILREYNQRFQNDMAFIDEIRKNALIIQRLISG